MAILMLNILNYLALLHHPTGAFKHKQPFPGKSQPGGHLDSRGGGMLPLKVEQFLHENVNGGATVRIAPELQRNHVLFLPQLLPPAGISKPLGRDRYHHPVSGSYPSNP